MKQKKLHPTVIKFKEFVKSNPQLIQEVRQGKATWQELFEEWYLLGEEDERWQTFSSEKGDSELAGSKKKTDETSGDKKSDWMANITGMLKRMDPNQLQYHVNNLSQAIGAIQGLLAQFQGTQGNAGSQPNQHREMEGPRNPFTFRKD